MTWARPVLVLVAVAAVPAAAEPASPAPAAPGAVAPRPPTSPHVVHAPTAWLQPSGQLHLGLGSTHRVDPSAKLALGLGGVAEVDIELTDRLIACPGCGATRAASNLFAATALFKMGAATRATRHWRLGAALGFRRTIATRRIAAGGRDDELAAAQLHLVTGARWRGLELHAGAELFDALHGGARLPSTASRRLRPLAAIAWTPPPYPRTTMLLDVAWSPEVKDGPPRLAWMVGWGVRYQALRWGAIELVVRQREDEALGDSTVMVRVAGALALGKPLGVGLR
jgi:hypothetical protein